MSLDPRSGYERDIDISNLGLAEMFGGVGEIVGAHCSADCKCLPGDLTQGFTLARTA